jgi:NAD/NADP transhydrogenase beta subunit
MPWQVNILLGRAKLGTDPQLKEMDEINPESPRTDVPPVAYMAPVASASAERRAAADREHGAC